MSLIAVVIGAGLAVLLLAAASTVGLHRDRGFYAAMLIAIAFFYPVFAAERFGFDEALLQAAFALIFVGLALLGYRAGGPGLLSVAFILHAGFDIAGMAFGFHAPVFWGEACLGFDWVLAYAVRVFRD